jgi:Spy/CpxP family protein refolding chaperone
MKKFLGNTLLLAMFAAHAPNAGAQDTFGPEDFDMPMLPPHGMAMGQVFAAPHHDAFFMNDAFSGAMPTDPMHQVMLAERLELSREQREALGKIVDEATPKMRDLMFRMSDARKDLDSALEGQGRDDAALRTLADAQGKLHADLLFLQLSTKQRIRKLLTDEQRAQLEDGMSGWQGARDVIKAMRERHKSK